MVLPFPLAVLFIVIYSVIYIYLVFKLDKQKGKISNEIEILERKI